VALADRKQSLFAWFARFRGLALSVGTTAYAAAIALWPRDVISLPAFDALVLALMRPANRPRP
jgi:hypothetical protein